MPRVVTAVSVSTVAILLLATAELRQGPSVAHTQSRDGVPRTDGTPEAPRASVTIPPIAGTGRVVHVPAGGDLQAAIDKASPGDTITLEPRATYRGPFRLRRKNGDDWIVVTTASPELPAAGRRVTPADARFMPRLVAASGSVIEAEPGAHHFRFVGLEIAPADGTSLNTLVRLGESETRLDAVPHHFIIERSYVHGDSRRGGRRGVALNSSHSAVIDSHLSDFKEPTVDAQAIAGWNGPGPFLIAGNYLEASGENVMFGGADPRIPNLVPADIEITRNHMAKPLRWKKDHPAYEGAEWSVKNLFELKNARRVRIEGNLFEYNWPHAQNGFAILFTVRNQDGRAPWSVVEDVTFGSNVVRHVAAGINVLGRDDNEPSRQTQRIAIRNNLFLDVGGEWGNGRLLQLLDGTNAVRVEHNTALQTGGAVFGGDHDPHLGFVFANNVVRHNDSGIAGSATAPGMATLKRYFPDAVVRGNLFIGGAAGSYPPGNAFAPSLDAIGARTDGGGRLMLTLQRPYAGVASDGTDPGADLQAIERALGPLAETGLRNAAVRLQSDDAAVTDSDAGILGTSALVAFWVALALLAYVYVGYPLLAALLARLLGRPPSAAPVEPFVSIVVIAYNEAERIGARIENLLALDYPAHRREIVVASDGSTDMTVEQARRHAAAGVAVRPFAVRRGKAAVLNVVVPDLHGEIVLFADARQRFEPGTLRALIENFADPGVGAVSGELILATPERTAAAGHGTAFYWRYEKFIRATEARLDSTVGATGAVYAIRRSLFQPIPDDTVLDDVLIPLRIVRQGFRVLFEPRARAHDVASATARQELVRKTRTIAGTFQLFARERWLLNPRANRIWFETVSHKALRLALPLLHAALLVASWALAADWWYRWAFTGQALFYAAALVGSVQHGTTGRRSPLFSVPCAICVLSWATIIGFIRFLMNRQQVTWERAVSSPSPSA